MGEAAGVVGPVGANDVRRLRRTRRPRAGLTVPPLQEDDALALPRGATVLEAAQSAGSTTLPYFQSDAQDGK